jgi:predicted glycosyltransferase
LKVLITPLHWGLGHVTRCVPLVRALLAQQIPVVLASDGAAYDLLKAEFSDLPIEALPPYHIRYDTHHMIWNMARQLPRILFAIRTEQWATERIVRQHGITHIISDNRYGCFSRHTRNVLLTHQLHLRIPNRVLQWSANRVLHQALRQFDEVWVPDHADEPSLSGALSHPSLAHPPVRYTGPLTRMQPQPDAELHYDIAVVLSGPEPQRTHFERLLIEQLIALPFKTIVVQGLTQKKRHYFVADHIEVVGYMTSADLNNTMNRSRYLICRSGYSSIMDLAVLGKKALLVPTPGQTEQEYLAQQLSEKGYCVSQPQVSLHLEQALAALENIIGFQANSQVELPKVAEWLAEIE